MAPVLSYITFPASETFKQQGEQVKNAIEEFTDLDGIINVYYGLQVVWHDIPSQEEDAKYGYVITIWESPEKLTAFRHGARDKFNSVLDIFSVGEIERHNFVAVQGIPQLAFESKVTEFVVGKPRGAYVGDAFKSEATELSQVIEAFGHPSAIGQTYDGTAVFLLAAGWDSVGNHWETAAKDPIPRLDAEIKSIADIVITHVSLKKVL